MVCGANVLFDVQVFAELLHRGGGEPGISVGYDLLGEAVVWGDMFAVEFGDSYGVDCFLAWDEYGSF